MGRGAAATFEHELMHVQYFQGLLKLVGEHTFGDTEKQKFTTKIECETKVADAIKEFDPNFDEAFKAWLPGEGGEHPNWAQSVKHEPRSVEDVMQRLGNQLKW